MTTHSPFLFGVLAIATVVLALISFWPEPSEAPTESFQELAGLIGDNDGDSVVSPSLSPYLSPSKIVSPTLSPWLSPSKTPVTNPNPAYLPASLKQPLVSILPFISPQVSPTPQSTESPTTPPVADPTKAGHVVINEIAWMGTRNSTSDEWIELYNPTNETIDLTGWTLKSLTGTNPDPKILLSGTIGPLSYFLLERTNDSTIAGIEANQVYTGALLDSGEILELRDEEGNIHDLAGSSEGWPAGDRATRASMERINASISGSDASNWKTFSGQSGSDILGTPKSPNSASL
ncbi:MAG: lamin tail domain-containing protein [Candidatus Yanofskybacteria bacterium]|nr:lamin tail domain-containing protein [Candidatus Yanofskybacteria bacterium]